MAPLTSRKGRHLFSLSQVGPRVLKRRRADLGR